MKTVIIEVRGGVVQDVYAEEGTRVVVVDWDDDVSNSDDGVSEFTPLPLRLMPEEAEAFIKRG